MIKKRVFACVFAGLICVMMIALTSCSGADKLVGDWYISEGYLSDGYGAIDNLTFFSNGTYTSDHPNYNGEYTYENGKLVLNGVLVEPLTYSIKVDSKKLVFYDGGDEICSFTHEQSDAEEEDENSEKDDEDEAGETEDDEIDSGVISNYTIEGHYSDGYAWVSYYQKETGENRYGVVDKKGKIHSCINADDVDYKTDFMDGSAYIKMENGSSVITDPDGKELFSPSRKELGELKDCGDGYYLFNNEYDGFDENGVVTTVTDKNGKVIYTYDTKNGIPVNKNIPEDYEFEDEGYSFTEYCGEGMIRGQYGSDDMFFVNLQTGESFAYTGTDCNHVEYGEEICKGNTYYDGIIPVYFDEHHFHFLDTSGNEVLKEMDSRFMGYANISRFCEGKALVYNDDDEITVACFDSKDGSFSFIEKYNDKIYEDSLDETIISEGKAVIYMRGNDEKDYFVVFDDKGQEMIKPHKSGSSYEAAYNNNRLVIEADDELEVYDENGMIVYSLSHLLNSNNEESDDIYEETEDSYYYDDMYVASNGTVVDKDGNIVFDTIDVSNPTIITE